jgi:hypothetical protein
VENALRYAIGERLSSVRRVAGVDGSRVVLIRAYSNVTFFTNWFTRTNPAFALRRGSPDTEQFSNTTFSTMCSSSRPFRIIGFSASQAISLR